MTSTAYFMNTKLHNHAIIIHNMQAQEPKLGDDTWTEGSERDGHTRTPKARRNLIKRQKTFEST